MSDGIASIRQTTELTGGIKNINMQKDDAKAQLQELFSESYFNGGQDSIDDIEKEIKTLEKEIAGWEDKLETLEKQVKELEGNIKDKSGQLTDAISNINTETRKFEKQQKAYIDEAITNAVNRTKSKNNPPQINTTFEEEFKNAIAGMPVGSTVIDALYGEQGVLSGLVETLFTKLDGLANESKDIINQVSNTKATISLLTQTKNNMSEKVDSLYKNTNNDTKIPIYSYEKETDIAEIADKYNLDVNTRDNSAKNTNFNNREYVNISDDESKSIDTALKVVDELAGKGFTFKEAMYAMTQLFPNLQIGYALSEQTGTTDGIVKFPTDKADGKYTQLANKIKGHTNAGGTWANSQVVQEDLYVPPPPVTRSSDPISVKDGNSSYYFMADDGDGEYDGVSDMLGYENGMDDFEAKYGEFITTNGAGEKVITGDALNSIMVMKLEEVQNADGSVGVKQSFMSAADAGMTEINLSSTKESNTHDINNSTVQHTFNVKMNGKDMVAEQTLEDQTYIDAVFNNDKITGENMFSQLSDLDISNAFSKGMGEVLSNSSAQYLENILSDLDGYKKTILDYADNGLQYTETEFREMIKRNKEEADFILTTAKTEGNTIYNKIQANYSMNFDDDVPTYKKGGQTSGEALNEAIQKEVTKIIQQKYETYGMSDEEYEQYQKEHQK